MTEPTATRPLSTVDEKLDRIMSVLDRIEPYLPLLERFAKAADNPAARFLARAGKR